MMQMVLLVFPKGTGQSSLYLQPVVVVLVVQNGIDVQFKMNGWMLDVALLPTSIHFTM